MNNQEEFDAEEGCFNLGCCVLIGLLSVTFFFGVLISELINLFTGKGFYPWVP